MLRVGTLGGRSTSHLPDKSLAAERCSLVLTRSMETRKPGNNRMTPNATLPLPTMTQPSSPAPMASAAFVYNDDNSVAWDRMWDTF